jgi:hypothetical protein
MPFLVNMLLLVATVKFFAWHKMPRFISKTADDKKPAKPAEAAPLFRIDGLFTTLWMALILTVAHGALWVGLDYFPSR